MDVPRTVVRNKENPTCLWLVTDRVSVFDINRLGCSCLKHLRDITNRLGWSGLKHLRDITSDSDFAGRLCA